MHLGIDIGSVSMKYALVSSKCVKSNYVRTGGDVINTTKKLLQELKGQKVASIGVTGSGRKLVKALVGADFDVDEITAHRKAVRAVYPDVNTIIEIGGQDSKLIYFNPNSVNFEMNNICAAGTGSFLDQQASRLGMSVIDFYKQGLRTKKAHDIASKCTVFAETDMVHAQQSGIPVNRIIRGVHRGMINNYFSQLCRGKDLHGKFLFEGGTSENRLLVDELAHKLLDENLIKERHELIVPHHNKVLGAIGVAMMGSNINNPRQVPAINDYEYVKSERCHQCPSKCGARLITFKVNNEQFTLGRTCQE